MQGRHGRFRPAPGTPLIGRICHFSYSVPVVTRLLYRTGYSVQMPARPAVERDEDAITAWQEVTWPGGKPPGRATGAVIRCRAKRL
ncbi:helix-turn-helix domain-containing protein [Streptomyces bungoensis]|uniref:helix-turn-helix domain-containing protein n=1 Tax=Streptomyces bungoensis TaxID=285568 RepID=UPI000A7A2F05|nr:winged helix-turn-helix domain-containing protein [Streptomyces bungoensis]